ncbi:IclR family transcriptional regulator [Streptomyces naphthomycinicus]|uniref:IclR family transcriptional regulator n=1 Tax=Streptomyces naphthomycinicus TaxID=2872625 RepID=UPI001CEDD12B|nr:helix-turn-helix domain-containing protein [Streptomyces sp. TML10]
MSNTGRGVLAGAFALLNSIEEAGEARLAALAAASGLPKSSAHRLLEQLVELGAVERSGGVYRMGPRIFRLGRTWQPYPGLLAVADGAVRRLAEATGATVTVCVLHEGRTMAAAAVQGEIAELVPVEPGVTWPASTAAGKVLTAWTPPGTPVGPLSGPWRRTASDIRERGVAFDREEVVPGVCCAAVPLYGPHGRVIASLASIVPAGRDLNAMAENLNRTARAIRDGLRRPTPRRTAAPLGS